MSVQYTDRPDLPLPIRRALQAPYYTEGLNEHFDLLPADVRERYRECHFSTTTLIRSPRQRVLFNRHSHKVVLDPMSQFWKMMGSIKHQLLQQHAPEGDIVERRLGMALGPHNRPGALVGIKRDGKPVRTCYIHGQGDRYVPKQHIDPELESLVPDRTLQDWKMTSGFAMMHGAKAEHIAQLNILDLLYGNKEHPVEHIQDVYIFRDWNARNIKEGSAYPIEQVATVVQPRWPTEETENYINVRMRAHLEAEQLEDDQIPHCTDEELWRSAPLHQAFKRDPKTGRIAMSPTNPDKPMRRKFASEDMTEAEEWINAPENRVDGRGKQLTYEIVTKKAVATRCSYCEIKDFCSQFVAEQSLLRNSCDDEDADTNY